MQDTMYKSCEYFCISWCECNVGVVVAVVVLDFFSLSFLCMFKCLILFLKFKNCISAETAGR